MGEKRNALKSCLIIGAAPCSAFDYICKLHKNTEFVICADGGAFVAESCGIQPDFWIGDGDSLSCSVNTVDKTVLPCEKDYTDLHCAVDKALDLGYERLFLCAVTGGRIDHFLANICLLEYISNRGAVGVLADEQNLVFLHQNGEMELQRNRDYQYVSIVPLDEELHGVTLNGLKYPLENATLYRHIPIGISNEPILDRFTIKIDFGRALIVYSKDV